MTIDPSSWTAVGLPLDAADVIVVRSATQFRAAYGESGERGLVMDLPGASTPRLDTLTFTHTTGPLFPFDR
jgi:microcystin degradation protein MlrC